MTGPATPKSTSWKTHFALALVLVLATFLVYAPGIRGPFVLDDGENITLNKAIAIKSLGANELINAVLANESGLLRRPLASLTFALNVYFAGGVSDPSPFKAINVAIHGINAILVYLLALVLLQTPMLRDRMAPRHAVAISAAIATIWALHPIQLTSVLYIVQRMTSLSALFMLAGLIGFVHGRIQYDRKQPAAIWIAAASIVVGTLFGISAKENAILLPLLAVVTEFALFKSADLSRDQRKILMRFYGVVVALPILLALTYIAWNPTFVTAGYLGRDFTLWQRLVTEGRVLWFYLLLIVIPMPHWLGLFHDDIEISVSILNPVATLPALVLWAALVTWALMQRRRFPLLAFGVLWFLACHVLESTILALEIAFEHRNYLAYLGPLFAVTVSVATYLSRRNWPSLARVSTFLVLALGLAIGTLSRAHSWSDIKTLAETELRNHPQSPRAQDFAARVALHTEQDVVTAINRTLAAISLQPRNAGPRIDLSILLNVLSEQVKDSLKHSSPVGEQERQIAVTGLSEKVRVSYRSGQLQAALDTDQTSPTDIEALLRDGSATVHALFSLDNLRRCVLTPPHTCGALREDAVRWHFAALQNTRTSRESRATLLFNLALLHGHVGQYQASLEFLRQAAALDPQRVNYRLGQVDYLIRTGRTDEAERLLEVIVRDTPAYILQANRATLTELNARTAQAKQSR